MEKLTSILVILDDRSRDANLLMKSLWLAREFKASVELFLCDAEFEYTLRHVYDERGLAQTRRARVIHMRNYLQDLRDQHATPDVQISIDAACESPLFEGIARKVFRTLPDLVMKTCALEAFEGRGALDVNDWQLVRTCPVPLLLSQGRPWPGRPRFAAALDVAENETPGLAEMILRTAEFLRAGSQGELDILFGERRDIGGRAPDVHAAKLQQLRPQINVADRIQILAGDPAAAMTVSRVEQDYDVLILGAVNHQNGATSLVGTITGELMNTLSSDFLLLKPSDFVAPVYAADGVLITTRI